MNLLRERAVEVGRAKPHITPYQRWAREWLCFQVINGSTIAHTGYTPGGAYHRWRVKYNHVMLGDNI